MARLTGQPQAPNILDAAEKWKRACLLRAGSIFTPILAAHLCVLQICKELE